MRQRIATIVAGSYWLSVIGAYLAALFVRDPLGFAFTPFMFLALPWSLFMYGLAERIPTHGLGATVYALLCFVFSGLNALALYFLIGGRLAHLRTVLFRRRKCDKTG
jgi:hypothetical protein